jgi:hypothetical protein
MSLFNYNLLIKIIKKFNSLCISTIVAELPCRNWCKKPAFRKEKDLFVIKFHCKNCGQKISVPDVHAGKKGKCPKCKTIVVVPEINNDISLKPQDSHTDNLQYIQQPSKPELRLEKDFSTQKRFDGLSADGLNVTNESLLKPEIKEKPPERRLPWILDIFLYPTSISGLINLGIFWILPILLGFSGRILPIPFIWGIADFIVVGYMYYFFMECIRDSASGGIRAPENMGSMPNMGDAVTQVMEIVASVVIFWGPLGAYLMYKIFWQSAGANSSYDSKTDMVFWLLLGYGIFFSPIGLLALAMFNSTSAFNPFLWITSILSTFFQYCGLVLFFCVLGWLVSRVMSSFQQSLFFSYLFGAAFIYLAMVAAHLLGRFYYLNSKKLNWEV